MLEFGSFRLYPQQRLLLENDTAIDVPGRAMDILVFLAERAGKVIAKDELLASAWPGTFVQEGNLRVQVNAWRKTAPRPSIRLVKHSAGAKSPCRSWISTRSIVICEVRDFQTSLCPSRSKLCLFRQLSEPLEESSFGKKYPFSHINQCRPGVVQ